MVELRICASQDGRMRRGCYGHVRISMSERDAVLRQGIEIRREPALRAEKSHAVGAGGIEGDEDDVGAGSDGKAGRWIGGNSRTDANNYRNQPPGEPHKKKGVYHRRTPMLWRKRLELELESKVHVSRPTLCDYGIAGDHVRRPVNKAEGSMTLPNGVIREIVKVPAIQNVVNFPAKLHVKLFTDLRVLDQGQVPLAQTGSSEHISPGIADSAIAWDIERGER